MVPFETAAAGLFSFVSGDVIPSMPNGARKFAAYMALGALRQDPESALAPYASFLKMSGILSADGSEVDEARLETALAEAFSNMPSVEFLGFAFNEQDAARLVRRVAKEADMEELVEFAEKAFEARLDGIRQESARNGGEFSCRDQLEETLSCLRGIKAACRIREMRGSPSVARRQ